MLITRRLMPPCRTIALFTVISRHTRHLRHHNSVIPLMLFAADDGHRFFASASIHASFSLLRYATDTFSCHFDAAACRYCRCFFALAASVRCTRLRHERFSPWPCCCQPCYAMLLFADVAICRRRYALRLMLMPCCCCCAVTVFYHYVVICCRHHRQQEHYDVSC